MRVKASDLSKYAGDWIHGRQGGRVLIDNVVFLQAPGGMKVYIVNTEFGSFTALDNSEWDVELA